MFCVGLPKAEPCEQWTRIFQGDSDGARCLQQPYTLTGVMLSCCRKLVLAVVNSGCVV